MCGGGGGNTVNVNLTISLSGSFFFSVGGCGIDGIPGVVFTFNGGTYLSDASGDFAIPIPPPGNYPWTLTCNPYYVSERDSHG